MIKSQELDEFIAVRVQDPRFQNEGSWNSYVDFKIFLHTNSKAFTAKTSCVRRRYSEFVWLKKKLQKNAGLVPVPDLPSKTAFFSFNNDDFIERRRQGLQHFLDKVLHMTVCLSDSQLHLFLQTQLPVRHIEDCVQGHTPYTVTDAILTYASSNQGWAQEELSLKQESSLLPVSYESVDSPAPHLPTLPLEDGLKFKTREVGGDMDDAYTETTSKTSDHTSDSNCNDTLAFKDVEASMWGIYSPGTNAKDSNRIVFSPCEAEASVEHADETQIQKADVCKTSNFVFEAVSNVVDTHSSNILEVIMHETDGYSDL